MVGSLDVTWQRDAMQTQMLIGGTWSDGTEQIAVHNPATGEQIATVAGGGPAEASAAVEAAEAAPFPDPSEVTTDVYVEDPR